MGSNIQLGLTMTEITEKLVFASSEWVDYARLVLEDLVANHGEEGINYSACEVFPEAPEGLAGPVANEASWHFIIEGTSVTVGEGRIPKADFFVKYPYVKVLPIAREVYTPERIELNRVERAKDPNAVLSPSYLSELHNKLAIITA